MSKTFIFQWVFYAFSMGFVYGVFVKDFGWEVKFWFGSVMGFGLVCFLLDVYRRGLL